MTNYTVYNLFDWLCTKGLLHHRNKAEAFILCEQNQTTLPFYSHLIMALSALICCISLIGFLRVSHVISFENIKPLMATGTGFIAFSLLFYKAANKSQKLLHSFLLQSALLLMITGKLLFVTGFFQIPILHISFLTKGWMISIGILACYHCYLSYISNGNR